MADQMDQIAEEIANSEVKLAKVQSELDMLEVLKNREAQMRKDVKRLTERIAELRKSADDVEKEGEFMQKPVEVAVPLETKIQQKRVEAEKDPAKERMNKMRNINKKLQQIDKLKLKDAESLDDEAQAKVKSEAGLRKKLAALEAGEDPESDDEPAPAAAAPKQAPQAAAAPPAQAEAEGVALPADAEERKKKIKALQKKLREIEQLKTKEGSLDAQAKAKRDSEQKLAQELAALEAGSSVFVYDEAAAFTQHKIEMEKQLKKLQKKVEQIETLKGKDNLDADMEAKLKAEPEIKKELRDLEKDIKEMNEKERQRVANRLGWQDEAKPKGKAKSKK